MKFKNHLTFETSKGDTESTITCWYLFEAHQIYAENINVYFHFNFYHFRLHRICVIKPYLTMIVTNDVCTNVLLYSHVIKTGTHLSTFCLYEILFRPIPFASYSFDVSLLSMIHWNHQIELLRIIYLSKYIASKMILFLSICALHSHAYKSNLIHVANTHSFTYILIHWCPGPENNISFVLHSNKIQIWMGQYLKWTLLDTYFTVMYLFYLANVFFSSSSSSAVAVYIISAIVQQWHKHSCQQSVIVFVMLFRIVFIYVK